ncbi:MAG: hypothetical protein R3251_01730 [Candidatus Spechtbacterales bacterium]|nr:hypothetical protein [Candidatus Spechtbacterales bacterium]
MQALIIFSITLFGWLLALGIFTLAKDMPRNAFIAVHYIVDIIIFGGIYILYFKFIKQHFAPFAVVAVAMGSLFIFEFILWRFVAPEQAHTYLNFVDWIVPAFIIASSIYFAGKYFG